MNQYVCQTCGKEWYSAADEKNAYQKTCDCGGELKKMRSMFCPKCRRNVFTGTHTYGDGDKDYYCIHCGRPLLFVRNGKVFDHNGELIEE